MAWQDSALSLLGVVFGGGIAAAAGSRATRRSKTAPALRALAAMHTLRLAAGKSSRIPDEDELRTSRARLLVGGAPWVVVEMFERATLASMVATWHLTHARADREAAEQSVYAGSILHPSRFALRPILQLAETLEQVLAEELERPLVSAVLSPVRRLQLRWAVRRVAEVNEVTMFPPYADMAKQSAWDQTVVRHLAGLLVWPRRRLRATGGEKPFPIGAGFYPDPWPRDKPSTRAHLRWAERRRHALNLK